MVGSIPNSRAIADVYSAHPEKKVTLYFIVTGFVALLVGALLGPFQAFNYAGINLYGILKPLIRSYYQGLTIHGVLNAIVFTSFVITGLMYYLPIRELKVKANLTYMWINYGVMVAGLLIAALGILANTSNVLYTFYPPLQGHWSFYIGAALIVVGSIMPLFELLRLRSKWKREHSGAVTPIVTYMSLMTLLMWTLASVGIVTEVVWFLIPWSLGLREGVDPLLSRTLFWFTAHPIVYYWLLPAYISWYALVPKQAGGELVSDSLARLAFVMFLLFSTPVGFHHQFTDPGVPAAWKMIHSMLTMFVGIPSMLTAFTVAGSLEYGGRLRGGKGVLGWIGKLPWGNASFTAQILAMLSFIVGGAGGIVNASFSLNPLIHNTAWIPGHFHTTVGTATTLTFMGMTFWLIPHLTRKKLYSNTLALAASWFWFIGMMVFALGMHWQGLLSVPRRAFISGMAENLKNLYADAATPQFITGISGVLLLIAIILYWTVLFATLLAKERVDEGQEPKIPFVTSREMRSEGTLKLLDNLLFWFIMAVIIVLVAYLPSLITMFSNQIPVPGLKPW